MRLHISIEQLKTIRAGAMLAAAIYRLRAAEYLLSAQGDANEFEHRGHPKHHNMSKTIARAEQNAVIHGDMADAQIEVARIALRAIADQEGKGN